MSREDLVRLTAKIVTGYISRNREALRDIGNLAHEVHQGLVRFDTSPEDAALPNQPMVAGPNSVNPSYVPKRGVLSVAASVGPDYVACMACGKKLTLLSRHLGERHRMSLDQYRLDYGLAADHPVVASSYIQLRRDQWKAQLGTHAPSIDACDGRGAKSRG